MLKKTAIYVAKKSHFFKITMYMYFYYTYVTHCLLFSRVPVLG